MLWQLQAIKIALLFFQTKGPEMRFPKLLTMFLASLMLTMLASQKVSPAPPVLPNPILYLTATEPYTANGRNWIRYSYDVLNKDEYPADMFAAAPALPPCGKNT